METTSAPPSPGTIPASASRSGVLLTGHSHQAWPDVAFDAQKQAWLDAAEQVDDKWWAGV